MFESAVTIIGPEDCMKLKGKNILMFVDHIYEDLELLYFIQNTV